MFGILLVLESIGLGHPVSYLLSHEILFGIIFFFEKRYGDKTFCGHLFFSVFLSLFRLSRTLFFRNKSTAGLLTFSLRIKLMGHVRLFASIYIFDHVSITDISSHQSWSFSHSNISKKLQNQLDIDKYGVIG